ncbi:MAG: hypothetical protein NBV68_15170 [Erythrobacter sp.]|uniref:hypothetical protein n=1 Tax=Erythrobacter sp. TaxID=1042 RepID=UPI0025CF5FAB|nr:hypothetical protein [Erythrobacter sp.]MCM0000719.1 hypothetical protein [Erythrobacter sp.]
MKAGLPLLALTLALAACAPAAKAPPVATAAPPPARPQPQRPAPVPVAPAPIKDSWTDASLTVGNWRYQISAGGPIAVFIGAGGSGEFVMSCETANGRFGLWRAGTSATPRAMTIRTETATRTFSVVQAEDTNPYLVAGIAPADPLLDAMALSKGRFAVEVEGTPALIIPSYAEVSRVIEDCR